MHIYGIQENDNDNLICKTAKETEWTLDYVGEGEGGQYERIALKHVYYCM